LIGLDLESNEAPVADEFPVRANGEGDGEESEFQDLFLGVIVGFLLDVIVVLPFHCAW
jgi:hypothetical protein